MGYSTRKQIRLRTYDYSSSGTYFVTICTWHKTRLFGHASGRHIILNEFGKIAHREWIKTARLRACVELDAFIIMPDHIHGILIIDVTNINYNNRSGRVMARHDPTNDDHRVIQGHTFGKPVRHSLSTIIGAYKSAVTRGNFFFDIKRRRYILLVDVWPDDRNKRPVKTIPRIIPVDLRSGRKQKVEVNP